MTTDPQHLRGTEDGKPTGLHLVALDELIGREGIMEANVHEHLLALTAGECSTEPGDSGGIQLG